MLNNSDAIEIDNTISIVENNEPWEKLPFETDLWYERFHTYLLDGAGRSIPSVMRMCGASPQSTSQWYMIAKQYRWKERANAWDILQHKKERESVEKERIENRLRRIAYLDNVLGRLEKAISTDLDADMLTWSNLSGISKTVISELRNEYDGERTSETSIGLEVNVSDNTQNLLKAKILSIREKISDANSNGNE